MTTPAGRTSPHWSKDAAKYLLPGEQLVVATRRHPAVLTVPSLKALPVLVLGLWLLAVAGDRAVVSWLGLAVVLVALGYLALHVGEWWIRHFLITKRRVMLISGVVVRTVAVMPLRRITDMTWQETPFGQLLGYGTFRFESAGQDQALSEVTYLPHADELYLAVSELLFGRDWSGANGSDEEEGGERGDGRQVPTRRPPPTDRGPAPQRPVDQLDPTGRRDTAPIPRTPPSRW